MRKQVLLAADACVSPAFSNLLNQLCPYNRLNCCCSGDVEYSIRCKPPTGNYIFFFFPLLALKAFTATISLVHSRL